MVIYNNIPVVNECSITCDRYILVYYLILLSIDAFHCEVY